MAKKGRLYSNRNNVYERRAILLGWIRNGPNPRNDLFHTARTVFSSRWIAPNAKSVHAWKKEKKKSEIETGWSLLLRFRFLQTFLLCAQCAGEDLEICALEKFWGGFNREGEIEWTRDREDTLTWSLMSKHLHGSRDWKNTSIRERINRGLLFLWKGGALSFPRKRGGDEG